MRIFLKLITLICLQHLLILVMFGQPTNKFLNYSKLKEGDTIPLLYKHKLSGAVYLFVDERACQTCNLNIANLLSIISEMGGKSMTFFNSATEKFASNFASLNKWKTDIISDELGAYSSKYGITNFPCLVVVNKNGIVTFIGIPGETPLFNVPDFITACENLSNTQSVVDYPPNTEKLVEYKRTIFQDLPIDSLGTNPKVMWNSKTNSYIVYSSQTKVFFVLDSLGKRITSCSAVPKNEPHTSYLPKILRNLLVDSVSFYDYDVKTKKIVLYDISTKTGNGVYHSISSTQSNNGRLTGDVIIDNRTNLIWCIRRPFNNKGDLIAQDGLVSIINSDSLVITSGTFPDIYFRMINPSPHYFVCHTLAKAGIVLYPNLADSISIFSTDGVLRKILPVKYSDEHQSIWQPTIITSGKDASHATLDSIMQTILIPFSIYGNVDNDDIFVVNTIGKEHYTHSVNDRKKSAYLVSIINIDKRTQSSWYSFPYSVMPCARKGDDILGYVKKENSMELVHYKFK